MLDASRRAAADALLDSTLLRVDRETYARFLELLDQPPQPNEALRQLLQPKLHGNGEQPRPSSHFTAGAPC